MSGFAYIRRRILCQALTVAVGATTVFGGASAGTPKSNSKLVISDVLQRVRAKREKRLSEEAHENRDLEVAHWMHDSGQPNPDNAALLYYQAFLAHPPEDANMTQKFDAVFRGAEPDKQTKMYLGKCMTMMEMAETASRMKNCTWGILRGSGPRFSATDLHARVSTLRDILVVDARVLAADGHYQAALERCLTVRRLARHLGNSSNVIAVRVARTHDSTALRTVQHVLGVMPPDAQTLSWLRGRLAVVRGVPLAFGDMLQAEFKAHLDYLRMSPLHLQRLRGGLMSSAENDQARAALEALPDEQIVARAITPFPHFFNSFLQIVDSDKIYEQKSTEMRSLYDKFMDEYGDDPAVEFIIRGAGVEDFIDRQYEYQVGHQAKINSITVAVEVYLIWAKTGRLPQDLPDYLPKDPFTSQSFVYETTSEGFALRCAGRRFQGRGRQEVLEFKIRK